jgi:hypothetical protein
MSKIWRNTHESCWILVLDSLVLNRTDDDDHEGIEGVLGLFKTVVVRRWWLEIIHDSRHIGEMV